MIRPVLLLAAVAASGCARLEPLPPEADRLPQRGDAAPACSGEYVLAPPFDVIPDQRVGIEADGGSLRVWLAQAGRTATRALFAGEAACQRVVADERRYAVVEYHGLFPLFGSRTVSRAGLSRYADGRVRLRMRSGGTGHILIAGIIWFNADPVELWLLPAERAPR